VKAALQSSWKKIASLWKFVVVDDDDDDDDTKQQ